MMSVTLLTRKKWPVHYLPLWSSVNDPYSYQNISWSTSALHAAVVPTASYPKTRCSVRFIVDHNVHGMRAFNAAASLRVNFARTCIPAWPDDWLNCSVFLLVRDACWAITSYLAVVEELLTMAVSASTCWLRLRTVLAEAVELPWSAFWLCAKTSGCPCVLVRVMMLFWDVCRNCLAMLLILNSCFCRGDTGTVGGWKRWSNVTVVWLWSSRSIVCLLLSSSSTFIFLYILS